MYWTNFRPDRTDKKILTIIPTQKRRRRKFKVFRTTVIVKLVGFGRTCAPVRCAHPSFWAHCHTQRGAARPSLHRSFAAPPKIKKLFPKTKCLPSGPNSGRQGHIFFHWAKLHPTELRCTLLSFAAPSWATLHPIELRGTLLSYAAFKWAILHHYLSFAAHEEQNRWSWRQNNGI